MKTNLAIAMLSILAISACSTASKETTSETTPQEQAASSEQAGQPIETTPLRSAEVTTGNLAAQLDEMQKRSVYFDFGEFVIKPEYQALIQHQADLLKAHANVVVTLQGNTDERGSSEYNLALGQRRANNVKKLLVLSGAKSSQVETTSFGEEKPRCTDHNESCWSQNRRADIVYK